MAKDRRLAFRVSEATYQRVTQAAKAQELTLSAYFEFLFLKTPEAANASLLDYAAERILAIVAEKQRQLLADVEALTAYWQQHPEKLFQHPGEASEGGHADDHGESSRLQNRNPTKRQVPISDRRTRGHQ